MTIARLSILSFSLVALAACPAGKAADTVKSDQPKVKKGPVEAGTDNVSCEADKNYDVLAVDWEPEMRGDLEVAMKQGTVLVEFGCDKLVILDGCTAEGGYGFLGMSRKEKVIKMKDDDEVKANLPLNSISFLANVGGGIARGTSLDVAMMMIGMRKAGRRAVGRDELDGDCGSATHFVSSATLGAFVMATGSAAKMEGALKFFGKGASGGSSSAEKVQSKDGDIEDCMKANPDDKEPPPQCRGVLRLKMKALKDTGKSAVAAANNEQDVADDAVTCARGLVFADGACVKKENAEAHQCAPGNAGECESQCKKGDADSCSLLGSMYWNGTGVDKDWAKSAAAHQKGCAAGSSRSCRYVGNALRTGRGLKKDLKKAKSILTKACESGDGYGCVELGLAHVDSGDGGKAVGMFRKACFGGTYAGCSQMGVMYEEGRGGLRKNAKLAVKFFEKGCKEGSALACTRLAAAMASGKGIKRDKAGADALYKKTCDRGYQDACGK